MLQEEYTGLCSRCQGKPPRSAITPIPHTRIENSIIDNMAQIGVYGYAVYSAIKRHLNQKTGDCYPSYATIARKIGIDRGTVIRYVKKLKALNIISPLLRFKEDGSPTSNQYNFESTENPVSSKRTKIQVQIEQDGGLEPPHLVLKTTTLVAQNHPNNLLLLTKNKEQLRRSI